MTADETLGLIDYVAEEAQQASEAAFDDDGMNYHNAVSLVFVLRARLHEIRLLVAEHRQGQESPDAPR